MPPFHTISTSLYRPHTVTVTAMLADMVDLFHKTSFYIKLLLSGKINNVVKDGLKAQ